MPYYHAWCLCTTAMGDAQDQEAPRAKAGVAVKLLLLL